VTAEGDCKLKDQAMRLYFDLAARGTGRASRQSVVQIRGAVCVATVKWANMLFFTGYVHYVMAMTEKGNQKGIHDEYSVLPVSQDCGSTNEVEVRTQNAFLERRAALR
jgi:hypothetical protein